MSSMSILIGVAWSLYFINPELLGVPSVGRAHVSQRLRDK